MTVGSFDTKQINELVELASLKGSEYMLIDNGSVTLKVTVDSLLGYIANQVNSGGGGSSTPGTSSNGIHFIGVDEEDIPIESRTAGDFYIRAVSAEDIRLGSDTPSVLNVSPNMRIKIVEE